MEKLYKILFDFYKKAPILPKEIKEFIVKYAPIFNWIAIIFTIPGIFTIFGWSKFMSYYGLPAYQFGLSSIIALIFVGIGLFYRIKAIPGLKDRKLDGWNMLYYAALIEALYALIKFDIGGLIIGTLVSLYFLFQVREFYKK